MTPRSIHAQRRRASLARALVLAVALSCPLFAASGARARPHPPQAGGARAPSAATVASLIDQAQRPAPSGADGAAQFGYSVALSADGTTALIGAPGDDGFAGAAWVFTRTGSTWTQQGPKLSVNEATQPGEEALCAKEANECGFGRAVALSADGATALVGAPRANAAGGAAWAFTRVGSTWSQFGERLLAGEDARGIGRFGRSVALSADGTTALIGAPRDRQGHGAAWAFARTGTGFAPMGGKLTGAGEAGGGFFGRSLALSADGSIALIGGPRDDGWRGAAWAFARSGSSWEAQGEKLLGGPEEAGEGRFGWSVALDAGGTSALVGAPGDDGDAGAAWTLARSGSSWSQQGPKLTAPGGLGEGGFAYSAALSADGATALIGAPYHSTHVGAAWTFARTGTSWTGPEEKQAGDPEPRRILFGAGLALSGDAGTALVGAPREAHGLGGVWAFLGPSVPPPAGGKEDQPPEGKPAPGAPTGTDTGTGKTPSASTGSAAPAGGVLGSTSSALPAPVLGVSGNVARLAGTVRVKLPGSRVFVLLSASAQIPFGSIVDARHGRVSVTTATPQGGTQTMVFYQGEFRLTQGNDGMVVSTLMGGGTAVCRAHSPRGRRAQASASHGKRVVRKLWAEGHGKYSTKGSYATGAVLGTRWLTEDLCEGTLIRVLTDRVAVTNLVNGKRVTVTAGHSYLAKAPHRRLP